MARDLLSDMDVVDALRKKVLANDEIMRQMLEEGHPEKHVLRAMSLSGTQSLWRARVSQVNRLHKQLVMTPEDCGEKTERDHAVPLDAIRAYVKDWRDCWIGSDEELVLEVAALLEKCLVKIRVRHTEHATLNQDWKFKMPPGHEDLVDCDVLARYALVYPNEVQRLREQLT
jgi:hypothetical protein